MNMDNGTYTQLWSQVAELEQQSLPQSADEKVEQIYQKALKEKNSPELLKALIHRIKYGLIINKDNFPDLIGEVEKYTRQDTDPVEQSMLYGIQARLYFQYFQSEGYNINRRTTITGYIPEDIREWPANIFIQKIIGNINNSIRQKEILQHTDALKYQSILETGNSSRVLRPTLYDFLLCEGIEQVSSFGSYGYYRNVTPFTKQVFSDKSYFLPAQEFVKLKLPEDSLNLDIQVLKLYQDLLDFRVRDGAHEGALVMNDLNRLEFVFNNFSGENGDSLYLKALNALEKKYDGQGLCVEVLFKKAYYYQQKITPPARLYMDEEDALTEESDEFSRKVYEICLEGIRKYPGYERINLLKNLLLDLTGSKFNVMAQNVVYPGKELELKVGFRNLNALEIEIYRINSPVTSYRFGWSMEGKYETSGTLVKKVSVPLKKMLPYEESDTTVRILMPELGCYEYLIRTDNKDVEKINRQFSVSRLASVSRGYDGKMEFLVTDRISGKPIEEAEVCIYKSVREDNTLQTRILTDKNGLAIVEMDAGSVSFYNVQQDDDKAMILSSVPWNVKSYEQEVSDEYFSIFTDRGIYRPGQTVYYKGIARTVSVDKNEVLKDKKYTLSFRDPNYREISRKTLQTNEFGSVSGEFKLPQNLLNGSFLIQVEETGSSFYFQVEEYKRPSFDIKFLPVKETFEFGDQIQVKGKTQSFSGVDIQQAKVNYQVMRRPHWMFKWGYFSERTPVVQGTVNTDENGNFTISFPAEKRVQDKNRKEIFYSYEVNVTITDDKGETQENYTSVQVGDKSIYLQADLDLVIEKDTISGTSVHILNLNNEPISSGTGKFQIYSLTGDQLPEKESGNKKWKKDQLVYSGDFTSGNRIDLKILQKIKSGKYRFMAQSKDEKGKEASLEQDFTLYSIDDKKPPVPTYKWVLKPKTECEFGENAEIILGSSAKNVYVLSEIFKDDKKIEVSRFVLNNENRKIKIPFKPEYEDRVTCFLTFIKDEEVYTEDVELLKKRPDQRLNIKLEVFRNKLIPGQKEEWKISVKDMLNKPVMAEVLSGMYDASLDKLYPHAWDFYPVHTYSYAPYLIKGREFDDNSGYGALKDQYLPVDLYAFDRFNWFGLDFYGTTLRGSKRAMSTGGIIAQDAMVMAEAPAPAAMESSANQSTVFRMAKNTEPEAKQKSGESVQVRQNFNETAFFYPNLKTNEAGETIIAFTVPESNTTWKFMALGHTKDLKFGQIATEAVSQKKLMVSPNMPRFVRRGDVTGIAASIANLSDKKQTGKVKMEFFNPETEALLMSIDNQEQPFSVEPGGTTSVSWTFKMTSETDLIGCRIVALSEDFSDGEQHLLPVLPDKILVTESFPLSVSGEGTRQFTFNRLADNKSNTLQNYRLTLEFASNPSWYAIQALPVMTNPSGDNAVSWFAAYYSNTLAGYIVNSTPKVKQIIDIWKSQGGTKETLLSNLEKNQELKAVLLEETPWVLEANNEAEQKQKLELLFDLNRSGNMSAEAINKLRELQREDGGWSWFKGMASDVSITQWMLYAFGQLDQLTKKSDHAEAVSLESIENNELNEMRLNAVGFIDYKIRENFENLKKYNPSWKAKNTFSTYELEYLLVRSIYPETPMDDATKQAVDFYEGLVEKNWSKNTDLYARSIVVMLMKNSGKDKIASQVIQSLRQHASHSDELGMYWANNNARSFIFQSATCIHTFIMNAFNETGASPKEMDAMKLWLLKQKQAQIWESIPATVHSVYALLHTGTDWLGSPGDVSLELGKNKISFEDKEAGTGYVKQVYDSREITPSMAKVSVTKKDAGPAWGAMYWQYFENPDKITKSATGLNVEKKYFIEKGSGAGKTLVPVSSHEALKVGDKAVVRLTVRNDRDMEYVMLKDMRPACFEPVDQISGTAWKEGVIYYQSAKDASSNFYFNHLPKGTYVFEYPVYVTRSGEYSSGIATIQCLYAPGFVSHSSGERVIVN